MYKNMAEFVHEVHGFVMHSIRLDIAGENLPSDMTHFCNVHKIHLENSPAYAPKSKKAAERLNKECWARPIALPFADNLPSELWGEAIYFSNWFRNRQPTKQIKNEIPFL